MTDVPWYQGVEGIDTETIGHLQTRGWDKLGAPQAAAAAFKAFKEAEKHIGIPADQILRLPKDMTDAEGMKPVWQRLGAPADAKDYDFSTVKRADGSEIDAASVDFFRKTVADLHLPKDAATRLVSEFIKNQDASAAAQTTEKTAALILEKKALADNWGANAEGNKFIAGQAVKALGVTPEQVAVLENSIGYKGVMEMFLNIGTKIGEDKFVRGNTNNTNVLSKEQAVAQLATYKNDEAWVARYLKGDVEAGKQMSALNQIING